MSLEENEQEKASIRLALERSAKRALPGRKVVLFPSVSRSYEPVVKGREGYRALTQEESFSLEKALGEIARSDGLSVRFQRIEGSSYVSYPRRECGGDLPCFRDEPVFRKALKRSRTFGFLTGLDSFRGIEDFIGANGVVALIEVCENRYREQILKIAEEIAEKKIRFVAVSGPSSSGKTTTANKLVLALLGKGIRPLRISLDDYYLLPKDCPKNPDGTRDVESLASLDVEEFQREMLSLLALKETALRTFRFFDHTVSYDRIARLAPGQPVILEGIHALNPRLLSGIPKELLYTVYICPQPQLSIGDFNPFPLSEVRLLRRLVRDERTRSTSFDETLSMWEKVRAEEFKSIYPGEENASYAFDSFFPYELSALKGDAIPSLEKIPESSPFHPWAKRMVKTLSLLPDLPLSLVPVDSTVREFAGGGSFHG